MSSDEHDEGDLQEKPKRYPLQWNLGLRPDETDAEAETVGDG